MPFSRKVIILRKTRDNGQTTKETKNVKELTKQTTRTPLKLR